MSLFVYLQIALFILFLAILAVLFIIVYYLILTDRHRRQEKHSTGQDFPTPIQSTGLSHQEKHYTRQRLQRSHCAQESSHPEYIAFRTCLPVLNNIITSQKLSQPLATALYAKGHISKSVQRDCQNCDTLLTTIEDVMKHNRKVFDDFMEIIAVESVLKPAHQMLNKELLKYRLPHRMRVKIDNGNILKHVTAGEPFCLEVELIDVINDQNVQFVLALHDYDSTNTDGQNRVFFKLLVEDTTPLSTYKVTENKTHRIHSCDSTEPGIMRLTISKQRLHP